MRDLRLYSKLPMIHKDFNVEYWRPTWGTPIPHGDFMICDYGGKVMDIQNVTKNAYFIITGDVREIFEKINFIEILDLVSIKPTLSIPYLIFAYEKYKNN